MTRIIEARHPGICPACGETSDVGDRIKRNEDDTAWIHETCPEPAPTKFDFDPGDVCGECFTVRSVNGACSCP